MNRSKSFSKILALALSFTLIFGTMPISAQDAGYKAIAFNVSNSNVVVSGYPVDAAGNRVAVIQVGDGSATFHSGTIRGELAGINMGTRIYQTYTVPWDVTLTVLEGETLTITPDVTLDSQGTIINNGTIIINGKVTNNGLITNNGTINNQGTITNKGTLTTNTSGSTYTGANPEGGGRFVPLLPTITTTSLPNGKVGTPYIQTLTATSTPPITWSATSSFLPDGLTLSADGIISGTPTVARTFEFTVRAANAGGSVTTKLSIRIDLSLKNEAPTVADAALAEPAPDTAENNAVQIKLTVGETSYTINGSIRAMDTAPVIIGNRTMVPLRFIAEALGAEVSWNGETRTAIVNLDDTSLYITIGELAPGMDAPAVIINERTMVPLRYISESLGTEVGWDPYTRMIDIGK